ncbi:MAG TPA: nuclear transport factor 2 family protein [Pyrinomonadaceae bacterium]
MSEADNVSVVQRAFEAFGGGDVPAFLSFLSEDVEWTIAGPPSVPYAGERRGHEGVTEFLQAIGGAVEFERFEPQEFIAQGDRVAVVGFERARLRSSGRTFDNPWVLLFTLKDGKITRFRSYEDTYAVAQSFAG